MRALSALSVMVLAGCSTGLELSVDLRSDLSPGVEVDEVRLRWEGAGDPPGERRVPVGVGDDLARGLRLADLAGLSPGPHRLRATLRLRGEDVASRSRAFELESDLAVTLVVTRACRDDGCDPLACVRAEGCPPTPACVRSECVGRVCLELPDDALCEGRCDPLLGCVGGGPADGGLDASTVDAGPPPRDAGGSCPALDCADPTCAGRPCDDGDPCTHSDRCAAGACSGTPIACVSDSCVTRSCDGTASCVEVRAADGSACADDGNACTDDLCRAGVCVHEGRPDGAALGGSLRCCGGAPVDISSDRANCGACGLACAPGYACVVEMGHPTCDCGSANSECHGGRPRFVCSTTWGVCACLPGGCPPGATCVARSGPDYCQY